ncbi:formate/nitrite transporter family protein [Oceanicella sp. SM1341]|uniref:formate/nitrite transporter family protein n=1 Tax=Oceanicella sp. SM1341 TaxID=1548889 RepID=UPI0021038934|nr:formate/nitrite transporter family protein [Oceanicella sp. SM1341]
MSYVTPANFVGKMVDAGEAKLQMAPRDALIRAYMAGAILALAAVFAVTVTVQTGVPIVGAILFPVGFCMLYLMGYDLLTGVFMLTPLALIDGRPGVTLPRILRHWGIVFAGNFAGALTVAVMMAVVFTYGFSVEPDAVARRSPASARPAPWATRNSAPPACSPSSSAVCCATGWSPPAWWAR